MCPPGISEGAAPLPPIGIGQELLDGRIVIRGELGRGNMGVVYRAEDRRYGREVALKTLSNFDPDRLYQLKREFRTLAGIAHRNLVRMYELGASGELWFLIMELIDGTELRRWLDAGPPRSRVLSVFADLAEGLRALHRAGLMHRDVKPTNVMVAPDQHAVLLDFGLAAPIRGTGQTLPAGTLDYMAPEQLWNESPGAPADWFSFGVTLYEALTGVLPFRGPNRLKSMRQPLEDGPAALVGGITPHVDALVVALLDPDPQRRPGAADVLRTLGSTSAQEPVETAPAPPPFVGREEMLRRLAAVLDSLDDGRAVAVHLHGPSGIGKSSLARRFINEARRSSAAIVLEGYCHPQESVPYKALDTMVDQLAHHLMGMDDREVLALAPRHAAALLRLFPTLGRVDAVRGWPRSAAEMSPADLRRRGCSALREVLGTLAATRRVVCWIDDIQWSDPDSAEMLRLVLDAADPPRVLLLLTSRNEDNAVWLIESLPSQMSIVDLPIGRLSEVESRHLAQVLARAAGAAIDADAVASEAHGSPFLVGELVRYFAGAPTTAAVAGPVTLARALGGRFQRLSPDERYLVEIVAVAGQPLEIEHALEASGLGPPGRLRAHTLCGESFLRLRVRDEQPFLEPYHDRVREFALGEMPADTARSAHLALADSIARSGAPDARRLVRHYLAGGAEARAARYALAAARDAERDLAFEQAADIYAVALRYGPVDQRGDVLARRAEVLAHAARRAESAHDYQLAAAAADDRERRTVLRVHAAEQLLYGGELKRGLTLLQEVLAELGVRLPAGALRRALHGAWLRARFMMRGPEVAARATPADSSTTIRLDALWRTARGMVMLDPGLADVLAGMHLLEALQCGDRSRALRAISFEAAIEANFGGRWLRTRSRRLLARAEQLAAETGVSYDQAWVAHSRAICAFFEGRWRDCIDLGAAADASLRRSGAEVSWDLAALHGFMLSSLANLGELAELSRRVDELVHDAERRRDQYALRVFRTGDAVLTWLAVDDVHTALHVADATLHDYESGRFTSQHRHHLVATVQSHLYAGDTDGAWKRVEGAWPLLRRAGFLMMDCLGTQLRYLKACVALAQARRASSSDRGRYLRTVRRQARHIARSALPMASPMAHVLRAGLAAFEGSTGAQAAATTAALRGFDAAGMALHREAARWHLGTLDPAAKPERQRADAWMRSQGVQRPDLMARAVVPLDA